MFNIEQLASDGFEDIIGPFESKGLTSVVLPDTITYIGDYAFFGNNLTSVKIIGKSSSSNFIYYYPLWGWDTEYSYSNIEWNYTE